MVSADQLYVNLEHGDGMNFFVQRKNFFIKITITFSLLFYYIYYEKIKYLNLISYMAVIKAYFLWKFTILAAFRQLLLTGLFQLALQR